MKRRSTNCSRRLQATTLIEVLAGLAILGSVTVVLLLARGRLLEQQVQAMHKLEGVKLADGLLADWHAQESGVPVDEAGQVTDFPRWSWKTQILDTETPERIHADVVQLQLFHQNETAYTTDASAGAPVVTVDILVPGGTE